MISPRCGEPASSSPSKRNLMLSEGVEFCARRASNAVRIAITPALSSEAERAYKRHSGLTSPPSIAGGNVTICPPDSVGALRQDGRNGGDAVHVFVSTGWPSYCA